VSILSRHIFNIRTKLKLALPGQPCLLCGAMSHHGAWCAACDAALPFLNGALCPVCALPTPDGTPCGRCLRKAPLFERTVAPFAYAFPLDRLVQALKFNEQLHLSRDLSSHLAQRVTNLPDCIVPMPLHPARLARRGHNQSLGLAREAAKRLNIPLLPHACLRVRDTPPQSELKWKEREKNMRKAFSCRADFSGMHVAMLDDVMTSGASLNALALALRRAGAREISAWVIARTLPHDE
jgi:ComF family protein